MVFFKELMSWMQEVGRASSNSSRHRNISQELGVEVVGRTYEVVELVWWLTWLAISTSSCDFVALTCGNGKSLNLSNMSASRLSSSRICVASLKVGVRVKLLRWFSSERNFRGVHLWFGLIGESWRNSESLVVAAISFLL